MAGGVGHWPGLAGTREARVVMAPGGRGFFRARARLHEYAQLQGLF